jgi:type IV pilus assembly protein PilB
MTEVDPQRRGARLHAQDRVALALLEARIVTAEQLEEAREAVYGDDGVRGGLMFHLLDRGSITPPQVAGALEAEFGQAPAALPADLPDRELLTLVPAAVAREIGAAPVSRTGGTLRVAMRDPLDADAVLRLRGLTGMDVEPLVADEHSLWHFLARCYTASDDLARTAGLAIEAVARDGGLMARRGDAVHERVRGEAVPSFVRGILQDGVRRRASDIHFEPYDKHMRVRYRIDGRLQEVWRDGDPRMAAPIAAHIKYLARMPTASDRMPQDGALALEVDGRPVQFRVGTLPTIHGEKVVLRALDVSDVPADLGQLGMEERERGIVERAIRAKKGLVLVTGPTNSGKSTTLAAILTALEGPEINIYTVEDPVERMIPGVQQVQVLPHDTDQQLNRSYAAVLRAFLRQDPNIIMVGEIRDQETGGITLKAALTGHFVLSTLHTNDAPGTITRLIDMGLERFTIAGALRAILAQRLVRRVCPRCSESYVPDPAELVLAGFHPADHAGRTFRKGSGRTPGGHRCEACTGTGYRGRIGLFEVLELTPAIRRAIAEGATELDVLALAQADGMRTLRRSAQEHALAGATSLGEVIEETSN